MAGRNNQPESTTEYYGQITLPNRVIWISSQQEDQVKQDIEHLLTVFSPNSKPNFEKKGSSTWVFHSGYLNGEEPVACITKVSDLPETFSAQMIAAGRMHAVAGAR